MIVLGDVHVQEEQFAKLSPEHLVKRGGKLRGLYFFLSLSHRNSYAAYCS